MESGGRLVRDAEAILLGLTGAGIGYLGLTGQVQSHPLLGLILITVGAGLAYSLGKTRMRMKLHDH